MKIDLMPLDDWLRREGAEEIIEPCVKYLNSLDLVGRQITPEFKNNIATAVKGWLKNQQWMEKLRVDPPDVIVEIRSGVLFLLVLDTQVEQRVL